MKAKKVLPTSPIKILAGGQLNPKKPEVADAMQRVQTQTESLSNDGLNEAARKAAAKSINTACAPAIPSMPSIKLKRLIHQTAAKTKTIVKISRRTGDPRWCVAPGSIVDNGE